MENEFFLEYDNMIEAYRVGCFGKHNISASLSYIKNKDNHKIWKDNSNLSCYFLILDWLKENHPELLI